MIYLADNYKITGLIQQGNLSIFNMYCKVFVFRHVSIRFSNLACVKYEH